MTEQTGPQVQNLAQMIDIQEGAVVSRELISRETGTVTLFAFDAGQGLSEHTAPFDALVYALEGEVDIIISGTTYTLKAGDTIVMPAEEPHALKAPQPFKMLLVMIRS